MVTTFNCHWKKSIKSWIGTNNLAFCSGWNGPKNYLISKYTKYVFKIQRVRHSPNTLLTMVDDQVLRMIPYLCIIKSQFSHATGDVRFPCVKRPLFCYLATNKVQLRWFSMNIILLANKYTVTFLYVIWISCLPYFPRTAHDHGRLTMKAGHHQPHDKSNFENVFQMYKCL